MDIGLTVISVIVLVFIFPQFISMITNIFVGLLTGIVNVFMMVIDFFGNLIQRK